MQWDQTCAVDQNTRKHELAGLANEVALLHSSTRSHTLVLHVQGSNSGQERPGPAADPLLRLLRASEHLRLRCHTLWCRVRPNLTAHI